MVYYYNIVTLLMSENQIMYQKKLKKKLRNFLKKSPVMTKVVATENSISIIIENENDIELNFVIDYSMEIEKVINEINIQLEKYFPQINIFGEKCIITKYFDDNSVFIKKNNKLKKYKFSMPFSIFLKKYKERSITDIGNNVKYIKDIE